MAIINSFTQQRRESQGGPRAEGYAKRDSVSARPRHDAETINEEGLHDTFEDFYLSTSIGELVSKNEEKSRWKSDYPEVFAKLGPQKLDTYVYGTKKRAPSSKRSDSPPKKKRKR